MNLGETPVPPDSVGLFEGLSTTRAIRRYVNEPVPENVLRDILFGATRAPSGSNRQPFRFIVLTDSSTALQAKTLIAGGAQKLWSHKKSNDKYDKGTGADTSSPKSRMARTMQDYVDNFVSVPALVLVCLDRYREPNPLEGASVFPACQNLLLAARSLGYGGVLTGFHSFVEPELRELLHIPDGVLIAACITLGKPQGKHGPVRRVPMKEVVYADVWGESAEWAIDPPGTEFTSRLI